VTWKHTQGLFSHKNVSFLVLSADSSSDKTIPYFVEEIVADSGRRRWICIAWINGRIRSFRITISLPKKYFPQILLLLNQGLTLLSLLIHFYVLGSFCFLHVLAFSLFHVYVLCCCGNNGGFQFIA
jgi:hypothetical protein